MIERFIMVLVLCATTAATAQTTAPVGSIQNPKQITSSDRGPDIDPLKLAAKPYSGLPLFGTFRSFMSGSYATAGIWVYAANDDQTLYDAPLVYSYPDFYKPTWGEVFDHVARQMHCSWSWNPQNRQFRFEQSKAEPFFDVTLAEGWRREDRGIYVWHAPKDQDFGLDIYYYGHFTASANDPDLLKKVRSRFALQNVSNWPSPPTEAQMSIVRVAGQDALYLKTDTPRPGGVWRQWSFVVDGHAFYIVSAMPKSREAELVPAIEKMVSTFQVRSPTTRP